MSTDETPDQPSETSADEDWKEKIKAEDAALEQKLKDDASQEETPSSGTEKAPPSADETVFPPADFSMIVATFSTQAMLAMGLFPNPVTNKIETNSSLASHCVDMLGVVEEKTKGNLTPDETTLLDTTLHQLRIAFIEQQKNESQGKS